MSVFQLKRLGLAVVLAGGCCASAFAQSGAFALPALPALPVVPNAPSPSNQSAAILAGGNVSKPAGVKDAVAAKAAPLSPDMLAAKAKTEAGVKALTQPDAEGGEDAESSEIASENTAKKEVLAGLPPLPAPVAPNAAGMAGESVVTTLPSIEVFGDKPKGKTWLLTKLAPTVVPLQTNFNYKRVLLPDVIYRTEYNRENQHLPRRMTREDYANLLFTSVARNDTEATRALLNAGTGLEVTNANGETPLAVAQRAGAVEVAALLQARGAK